MLLRAFWLVFLLACSSSSYAGLFDDEEARRQIAAQQASIGDLRNKGQMFEARIAKMEEALNNQPLLELHNQMEALRADLNKLNGQIEVLVNENELTQKRQKDFYIDLDSRLRRIEQPDESTKSGSSASSTHMSGVAPESHVEAPAAVGAVVSPAASTVSGEAAETRDYESAYSLFKTARYQDAISHFKKFLKTYPGSSFVPSAHYWIGNSYYAMRDFKNAISTQEKLINAYPDSAKAPDAMLNIASSQQELNQKAAAQKTLGNLVAKYPGSEAAEKAKRRLISKK